jgi:hypothetical protein
MNQSKELLRKQLALLAEQSEIAAEDNLPELSSAMADVYDRLERQTTGAAFRLALLLLALSNLVASILILLK